jgi:sulfopyruvate decarboxylase subunit alpha
MPKSAEFLAALEKEGYDFFAGVPCSLLKGVIRRFDAEPKWGYVSAVREDSALGMSVGAWLAGKKPAVFMQNSGLGVSMNAIASLNLIYEIPALVVVTWRGEGGRDAPEHLVMGEIMDDYFKMLRMPWKHLRKDAIAEDVAAITREIATRKTPGALVVSEGILDASR